MNLAKNQTFIKGNIRFIFSSNLLFGHFSGFSKIPERVLSNTKFFQTKLFQIRLGQFYDLD